MSFFQNVKNIRDYLGDSLSDDSYFTSKLPPSFHQPGVKSSTNYKLESKDIYLTSDVISEGQIAGLSDSNGNLMLLTEDYKKNSDAFKGIYFNDVPIKNTLSNTYNYNRVFAELKTGSDNPVAFSSINNSLVDFNKSYNTLNANVKIYGPTATNIENFVNSFAEIKNKSKEVLDDLNEASNSRLVSYDYIDNSIVTNTNLGYDGDSLSITMTINNDLNFQRQYYLPKFGGGTSDRSAIGIDSNNLNVNTSAVNAVIRLSSVTVQKKFVNDLLPYCVNPYIHTIHNQNCDQIMFRLMVTLQNRTPGGGTYNSRMAYYVQVGYQGDYRSVEEGGSIQHFFIDITGEATAPYIRNYVFALPPSVHNLKRFIKIYRLDADPGPTQLYKSKEMQLKTITEVVPVKMTYPNTAIMNCMVDGRSFANPPTRTFDIKGIKVLVPNNYDPETKTYVGDWNGLFAVEKQWTDNPAWILYDYLVNDRYGAGKFSFRDYFLDKWNLYKLAKYCDEYVPTGNPTLLGEDLFTIKPEDNTKITIDAIGQDQIKELQSKYVIGSIINIINSYDVDGNNLSKSYKRVILNVEYNSNTSKIEIKLGAIPSVYLDFINYPDIKQLYLNELDLLGTTIDNATSSPLIDGFNSYSPIEFLLQYITQQTSSTGQSDTPDAYQDFYNTGEPLDSDIVTCSASPEDLNKSFDPVIEPRFRCNIYYDRKQNALNAVNDIAAIFRGLVFWSTGYIYIGNDQNKSPVMLFNNSNVKDGSFSYSGSAETARSTAAIVRYNDETDFFKPKVEYLEDTEGIRKYGYREKEIIGLGITSRTQAFRLAKWMLFTNQTETDLVQFSTGQEATYLQPSDIIRIKDTLKTAKRYGGRIQDINYSTREITLDEGIQENIVGQKIVVVCPTTSLSTEDLNKIPREKSLKGEDTTVSLFTIDQTRAAQIKEFTIDSVTEQRVIKIREVTDLDFNKVKAGFAWSIQNDASNLQIDDILYRVLSVTEKSQNEYQVTAMMYNQTKFGNIDQGFDIKLSQQSKSILVSIGSYPDPIPDQAGLVVAKELISRNASKSIFFDGQFTTNPNFTEVDYKQVLLSIDFTALTASYNASNTGGYVLQVSKADTNDYIRITLDGYDNTTANILFGDEDEIDRSFRCEIYRYDSSKKLQVINL